MCKGTPDAPRCGFSSKVVGALKDLDLQFDHFDILQDQDVRQGLKEYSQWPTYPQLYAKGELVGGCDIILEMKQSGELKAYIDEKLGKGTSSVDQQQDSLELRLKNLISAHPVMLFMKGSPDAPRCGFSAKVTEMLREAKVNFDFFDILQDQEVRQGLKEYSNWPTYPQLYVKSDFLGGCDVLTELQDAGELKSTIEESLKES